jgi:hypothetical protein
MKFKSEFERDYNWYLSVKDKYDFDGVGEYIVRNTKSKFAGQNIIQYDENGVTAKEAFYKWDSCGVIVKTFEPDILYTILKTKGSVNFHIKMYAESLNDFTLFITELKEISREDNAPDWFLEAVFNYANKLKKNERK